MASYAPLISAGVNALGTGASIYSGIQGKNQQEKASQLLRDLAGNQQTASDALLQLTAPLRLGTASQLGNILAGAPASSQPGYAPQREAIEAQFGRANEAAINNGVRGGLLPRLQNDLNIERARAVSGLEGGAFQNALNLGSQIGFNAPGTAFGGVSPAFGAYSNLANAGAQQGAAAGGSLSNLGLLLSLMGNKG